MERAETFSALFPLVKRKLNITWTEKETDLRAVDVLRQGIDTLSHKLGLPDGYPLERDGAASALVLNWCLYEWNSMANAFNADYADEVDQVRSRILVKARAEKEGEGDGQTGSL